MAFKAPGSFEIQLRFEIHWVRQYMINAVLFGIKDLQTSEMTIKLKGNFYVGPVNTFSHFDTLRYETLWYGNAFRIPGACPTKYRIDQIRSNSNFAWHSYRCAFEDSRPIITKFVVLSWRVPNFVMIGRLLLKLGGQEFSANFEFDRICQFDI